MLDYRKMKRILHSLTVFGVLTLAGCDTFFRIDTIVTDATTGQPIPYATVTLILDRGVGEPAVTRTTGSNGVVDIVINEHSSAWATLTVEKTGYQTWSTQYRGRPRPGFVIRMKPEEGKKTEQGN